ncbi:cell envelope integrity EipB family protein [Magnetospira thiophila]
MTRPVVFACAVLFLGIWGGTSAQGVPLVSHRALYQVSLKVSRAGSDVSQVSGILYYRFQSSCDGWSTENRSRLFLGDAEGGTVENLWSLSSWETHDGTSYRFWGREVDGGAVVGLMRGTATMTPKGGQAVFSDPQEVQYDLPAATLFPSRHLILLLEAAQSGKNRLSGPLFDGADDGGAMEVNAVILPPRPPADSVKPLLVAAGLEPENVVPIQLAFFDPESVDPLPVVEVSAAYRQDGIAESLVQDFGDFAILGRLIQLERLPDEGC